MSWPAEQDSIRTRIEAMSTVPEKVWDAWNADDEPPTPSSAAYSNSIWVRPSVAAVPGAVPPIRGVRGPGAIGLGSTAPNYREGLITQSLFAARGSGLDELGDYVWEAMQIFHRASFGVVRCWDVRPPDVIGFDPDDPEWFGVNVVNGYYVIEEIA
jgi:hypothetical protein